MGKKYVKIFVRIPGNLFLLCSFCGLIGNPCVMVRKWHAG